MDVNYPPLLLQIKKFHMGSEIHIRLKVSGVETISMSKYCGFPIKANRIKIIHKIGHIHKTLYLKLDNETS